MAMTAKEIKALPLEKKIDYFRALLKDENNENETDILNVFRLINSYNVFDTDFFSNEESYISDISEFIDIKAALEQELKDCMTCIITWYLSLLSSCDIPLHIEQDDSKVKIPPTIYGIFLLGSIPLMSSIMGKINLADIDMTNLYKVQEGFSVVSKLFQNHDIVNAFLNTL